MNPQGSLSDVLIEQVYNDVDGRGDSVWQACGIVDSADLVNMFF